MSSMRRLAWKSCTRRFWSATLVALSLPWLILVATAIVTPLPASLKQAASNCNSVRYEDRNGHLLREMRDGEGQKSQPVPLALSGRYTAEAIMAAEDKYFRRHPGIDPIAIGRASGQNILKRRIVSGASTLTMQLARLIAPHGRSKQSKQNWWGKFKEAALALRIEMSLSKNEILEEYLNRAPFGPSLKGVESASRAYFDKHASEVSLVEAATLAAIPRGPAYYAMHKHPDRVLARRNRILERMWKARTIEQEEYEVARGTPLIPIWNHGSFSAPHLITRLHGQRAANDNVVRTTIDADLQRDVERAAARVVAGLSVKHVSAASVLVIDNASGDVLAYVGSHDFSDDAHGGQNDGVRARRQPGSTLKPFIYGLAMDRKSFGAHTALPDVELTIATENGRYMPRNYDEKFHGPVRLRDALANSLNVPAVWTVHELGPSNVLLMLRDSGFASLERSAEHYGEAIALGDGEVTLEELVQAYRALANDGVWRSLKYTAADPGGAERRIMTSTSARLLTDILADADARAAAFGRMSPLSFDFEAAAKTGTSKGFRDNWAIGFTRQITVGVWVGNFDGSPMREVSGVVGAAPLMHEVLVAAMRGRAPVPLRVVDGQGFTRMQVCALTGERVTSACSHTEAEWIRVDASSSLHACSVHRSVRLDRRNGLLASPRCPREHVVERVVERFEGTFEGWAKATGRSQPPDAYSPLCGAATNDHRDLPIAISRPLDGSSYAFDPSRNSGYQALEVQISRAAPNAELVVDGSPAGSFNSGGVRYWQLRPGTHELVARLPDGSRSPPIRVTVD